MENFDFIGNRVFDDRPTAFAPQAPQMLREPGSNPFGGRPIDTGAKVLPNGDVCFGLYAPEAKEVKLVFGIRGDDPVPMERGEDGIWSYLLPYDPAFKGPKAFWFLVDGGDLVSPYCSQYYSHSKAVNYVEIPDPAESFILMRDVPHGSVVTDYFWSTAQQTWQRCLIYLPPNYFESDEEYPVFCLQHGAGENETSWVYDGKANHIMDNLIADGEAVPMIVVMNDGMARGENDRNAKDGGTLASNILKDCLPMVEKKYRVKKDKWNRAIAGFSMGSMQACIIALTNPDKFAYVGLFSGFMRYLGPDTSFESNPHLLAMKDREKFEADFRLFYRSRGSKDSYISFFEADDVICRENGFDTYKNYVKFVVDGYPHDWAVMRILLHDFAKRLFKD